jgi:hypothetical protein
MDRRWKRYGGGRHYATRAALQRNHNAHRRNRVVREREKGTRISPGPFLKKQSFGT